MTTDPLAWALLFVILCLALYAVLGVLAWKPSDGFGVPAVTRDTHDMLLLLTLGDLAGLAVTTCYLLALNGWI